VSYQRKEYQQETRWLVAVRDDDGRTVRPTFGQRIYSWTPGDYTVMGLRVYR
jgi:hypothetical protein